MANKTELKVVEDISSLYYELETVQDAIADFKRQETLIKARINSLYKSRAEEAYHAKDEPFGSVSFKENGFKVTFVTPKKVKWDQEGLAKLHAEGAPVDVEYGVKEVVFKDLDSAGKNAFMPYRTVEPGTTSVKVEKE